MKYLKLFESNLVTKRDLRWCFDGFEEMEPTVDPKNPSGFKAILCDMDDSQPPYFLVLLLKYTEQFASVPYTLTSDIRDEIVSCIGHAEDLKLKMSRITVLISSKDDDDFIYNSLQKFEEDIPVGIRVHAIHINLNKL